MIRAPFDKLVGQPLVSQFLSSAIENQQINHAYLFVGPIGTGKTEAARALALALACKKGGCGACDDCIRVLRGTHPDVKTIEPEGVNGYVVEQIQGLIHDTNLAPIRAQNKVYLITRADLLVQASANAFLKTLEEPPSRVVFILLARTQESVLETIASRCQVIAFRFIPEADAILMLTANGKVSTKDARIALASTGGSLYRARDFLGSSARREARIKVLGIIERIAEADALDILEFARDLLIFLKQPLDEVRLEQEKQLAAGGEFLSKGALTSLEQRQKRALTVREREVLVESFGIMRSWLRDCLLVCIGRESDVVCTDFIHNIQKTAYNCGESAIVRSIRAVDEAEQQIHYNVSVQSIVEALFLKLRDELGNRQHV